MSLSILQTKLHLHKRQLDVVVFKNNYEYNITYTWQRNPNRPQELPANWLEAVAAEVAERETLRQSPHLRF